MIETSNTEILKIILKLVEASKIYDSSREQYDVEKVVQFRHPAELTKLLDLKIGSGPVDIKVLEDLCQKIIDYSVKTMHPKFYNQLFKGVDIFSLGAAWLTEALNTPATTYEIAPVFTVVENEFLKYVRDLIGMKDGDGIFAPGGSIANMYGMTLARFKICPDYNASGMFGRKPMVAFTSEEGHYWIAKCANWLGIGTDNVVTVRTDSNGRMIPSELESSVERCRREGKFPFFVNCTCGSMVLGSYDDLEQISSVCRRQGLWMHVDAAWGGSALISKRRRGLMNGVERADSLTWNAHEMAGVPTQSSAFVTSHSGLLARCNSCQATYLFQPDKFYDVSYDTGDKSIQCGRKSDSLKTWFLFKARGEDYLSAMVDRAFDHAAYLYEKARTTPGFKMVIDSSQCTNVCFWYVPKRLRGMEENEAWWDEVHLVAPKIKERMVKDGSMMIGYQPLAHKNHKNFFRVIIGVNPKPTLSDMDDIVQIIDKLGMDL